MIQEEKELLLKDICTRLPYGVKALYYGEEEERHLVDEIDCVYTEEPEIGIGQYGLPVDCIKLYLYPISSITQKQLDNADLHNVKVVEEYKGKPYLRLNNFGFEDYKKLFNFFCKNHIDFNDLIAKDLANDATNLNIY